MKTKIFLLATIFLLAVNSITQAQSKLQWKVITSSPEGFWVNSTLIYGDKDAVLIDAQFTISDAKHLVSVIQETKKNLTTVYITHFHPDHYFGLVEIKKAFPNAKIVAMPSTVNDIKNSWEAKVKQWKPSYGDNIPSNPVIPDPLGGNTIELEGQKLTVFGNVQGDALNNSYVWIPSLKAVVCGDIAYNGVYPWTLETTPATRKNWISTIDKITALNPTVVIAGHKNPELKDDPSSLQFTKNYLTYYDDALASSKSSEEFQQKVKAKFPGLGLDIILKLAADAAFSTTK